MFAILNTFKYRLAQRLAGLLGEHIGDSPHHVRNSMDFIHTIRTLRAGPWDILVSFDVVSLFTMVPLEEALRLLGRHFDEAILFKKHNPEDSSEHHTRRRENLKSHTSEKSFLTLKSQ
jgi:hypothetical protein